MGQLLRKNPLPTKISLLLYQHRLEKQISRAKLNQSKPEIIKELELKKLILQKSKVSYNHCCYSISTCLHPFDINHNTVQTTELVKQSLENIQASLQNIYTTHRLQDPRSGIRKLKTQNFYPAYCPVLSWLSQNLSFRRKIG